MIEQVKNQRAKSSSRVSRDTAPVSEALRNSFLSLTTIGRYSRRPETSILNFSEVDGRYILVAHDCDQLFKPDWYLNLKEEPVVEVEVNGTRFDAKASTPTGTDRLAHWQIANDLTDNDTLLRIPRQTAVVVLDPFV